MLSRFLNEESSHLVVSRKCEFTISIRICGIVNNCAYGEINIDGGLVETITSLQHILSEYKTTIDNWQQRTANCSFQVSSAHSSFL